MIKKKALLIDTTLCIGCNACQAACKEANHLPDNEEKSLSPTAYTALQEYDGVFVRRLCQHCDEPTCVSVCPVGAFTKTELGPVLYDETKCIGCRYCMQACPFQVPRYEWSSLNPRVRKCILCHDRIAQGLPTACAEACPTGATTFGDRDDMLVEAMKRISADPTKYVHKIYGQSEVGGTSIFYLSSVPFEQLGFNTKLQTSPMPQLTWNALSKIPGVVSVGGVMLFGIYWITNRRREVQAFEAKMREEKSRKNGSSHSTHAQ